MKFYLEEKNELTNWLNGAEAFLKKIAFTQLDKKFSAFKKHESSTPRLWKEYREGKIK
jgi:hypothetical protein